jgi:hypothetical protein
MKFIHIWKAFFEYFFYRIAKLNLRFTKPDRAITSVSLVQLHILVNILLFFEGLMFPNKRGLTYYEVIIYFVLFFIIDYFNVKIYEGRYEEFDKRWGNEPRKKKIIGLFVVISAIIFSIGLIFINGLIFDRFKK